MKKLIAIAFLGALLQQGAVAQEHRLISLNEVLAKVQEANTNIRISGLEADVAKADYGMSSAVFLPNVSISHTGFTTTNPLTAFGSKLNQEVITQADFNPQLLNDPNNIENFATIVSVQQPLINVDGFYRRKAAKSTFEAKELQFKRTKEYINFEAHNAYMQLQLAYKMVAVLTKADRTAKANKKQTKDYYDQGLIQKADWLMAQVRASEVNDQLRQAKSNLQNASDYLGFLMNADPGTGYEPQAELLPTPTETEERSATLENRADIKAMQKAAAAHTANYRAEKMTFLPRLNAFGSYELYDQDVFGTNAEGYTFGASLSWDIFKGAQRFAQTKKGKAEADKAELQLAEYRSKSIMELQRAQRLLADAKSKLSSSELALEQAEETLQIRTNRYKEGLEKTTDLLMTETRYVQQELAYYQTVYEYNYAKAYQSFLTKE
ncbi:TolC family protein [Allomuricauda sp. SCSIO 65647]|uniref:TolC family protein n=1 Tax=Allomuricauda sp. SCSIO 65647 TaxID=2908843 RepID=UPI001F43CC9A|nr:TolC family protein [Muricauda sp. SCSIO 65647]UJH68758.1 TolC family protein [Muricauda sp. SCSIO 65647]